MYANGSDNYCTSKYNIYFKYEIILKIITNVQNIHRTMTVPTPLTVFARHRTDLREAFLVQFN